MTLSEALSGPPKIGCFVRGCKEPWMQVHTTIATLSACGAHFDEAVRTLREAGAKEIGRSLSLCEFVRES